MPPAPPNPPRGGRGLRGGGRPGRRDRFPAARPRAAPSGEGTPGAGRGSALGAVLSRLSLLPGPEGPDRQSQAPRPRGAGAGLGWQRLQRLLGPRAGEVGAGASQQRLPFGEAVPSGCTARFGARGPRWKVQSDPAPRPRSGDGSGFACFRLCGSLSSAPPTRGPDRSRQLAGGRL